MADQQGDEGQGDGMSLSLDCRNRPHAAYFCNRGLTSYLRAMFTHNSLRCRIAGVWLLFPPVALVCASEPGTPAASAAAPDSPEYFPSVDEAVRTVGPLLERHDWATLARCYDLSLTPQVRRESLLDGSFFLNPTASANGPKAITRWLQPFAPGATFVEAKPLGDPGNLPCVWSVTTVLTIDQGGGPAQRVVRTGRLLQTREGFRFLPPAPTEGNSAPAPTPVADREWQAQGAEPILFYRPALRARVERELPAERSANIPVLAGAVERLQPLAAANPGLAQPGTQPWDPAVVYHPTDEELILSLAGDRIWRALQLAPPGILAKVRADNPSFTIDAIEYPHIEIVRIDVAGSGSRLYALPPVKRHVNLKETADELPRTTPHASASRLFAASANW